MEGNGTMKSLRFFTADDGRPSISYTIKDRKMCLEPVEVVRNCICQKQGKKLCGVCVLRRRWTRGKLFPNVTYKQALGLIKSAACRLHLDNAQLWATHAFRRGFAAEALKEGGPQALFYSGGWKGVAALGYADAQARGALAAAEWVIDHSDSSDSE